MKKAMRGARSKSPFRARRGVDEILANIRDIEVDMNQQQLEALHQQQQQLLKRHPSRHGMETSAIEVVLDDAQRKSPRRRSPLRKAPLPPPPCDESMTTPTKSTASTVPSTPSGSPFRPLPPTPPRKSVTPKYAKRYVDPNPEPASRRCGPFKPKPASQKAAPKVQQRSRRGRSPPREVKERYEDPEPKGVSKRCGAKPSHPDGNNATGQQKKNRRSRSQDQARLLQHNKTMPLKTEDVARFGDDSLSVDDMDYNRPIQPKILERLGGDPPSDGPPRSRSSPVPPRQVRARYSDPIDAPASPNCLMRNRKTPEQQHERALAASRKKSNALLRKEQRRRTTATTTTITNPTMPVEYVPPNKIIAAAPRNQPSQSALHPEGRQPASIDMRRRQISTVSELSTFSAADNDKEEEMHQMRRALDRIDKDLHTPDRKVVLRKLMSIANSLESRERDDMHHELLGLQEAIDRSVQRSQRQLQDAQARAPRSPVIRVLDPRPVSPTDTEGTGSVMSSQSYTSGSYEDEYDDDASAFTRWLDQSHASKKTEWFGSHFGSSWGDFIFGPEDNNTTTTTNNNNGKDDDANEWTFFGGSNSEPKPQQMSTMQHSAFVKDEDSTTTSSSGADDEEEEDDDPHPVRNRAPWRRRRWPQQQQQQYQTPPQQLDDTVSIGSIDSSQFDYRPDRYRLRSPVM